MYFSNLKSQSNQGSPWLSVQTELAPTDQNMHARKILKLVLKFWDYDFFGTSTHFYEMPTMPNVNDLQFQK